MTRNFRIILFTGIVAAILFSGVCATGYAASPLLDGNITLTKTGSPTTFSEVGEIITYTYVLEHSSNYEIFNISITDDLIDNVNCPETYFSSGTITCTGEYTITEEDLERGEVINNASVSGQFQVYDGGGCCGCGSGYDYYDVSASDSFTVSAEEPEVSLEKSGSPSVFTAADQNISYTYTVTNTGTVPLDGPVTVSDNKVDVSCPAGSLAAGATVECSASYTTTEEDVANGFVRNTATASANGINSNEDSFEVVLEVTPELSLTKSASPGSHTNPGELITYNFTLTNEGNVTLSNPFSINDPQVDEFRCSFPATLAVGESFQCNGYYLVRNSDAGNTINNCADATATYQGNLVSSSTSCADTYYQPPAQEPPVIIPEEIETETPS